MTTTLVATTLENFPKWRLLEGGTSLDSLVERFQQQSGHLDPAVKFDLENGTIDRRVEGIGSSVLYPVCEAGMNRSQITYHVAKTRKVSVMPPHGTIGSVDMVVLPSTELQQMWRNNIEDFSVTEHPFYQHLPVTPLFESTMRVKRFGEDQNSLNGGLAPLIATGIGTARINPGVFDRIREARQWMEENYFLPLIQNGGVVLAYNKAVHGMLFRLLEIAERHNLSLEKVRIIPIQSDDPFVNDARIQLVANCRLCVSRLIASAEKNGTDEIPSPIQAVHQKMWAHLYRIDCATNPIHIIVAKALLWLVSLLIIPPVVIWCAWSLYDCYISCSK